MPPPFALRILDLVFWRVGAAGIFAKARPRDPFRTPLYTHRSSDCVSLRKANSLKLLLLLLLLLLAAAVGRLIGSWYI